MSGTVRNARRRIQLLCLLTSGLISGNVATSSDAEELATERAAIQNEHLWKPKTRTVAVFKNGLAFFSQEGVVTPRDGWCYAQDVPPAAFGTLAIYALNPEQVVDVVGTGPGEIVEFDGHHAPSDLDTKRERLRASLGLDVNLHYQYQLAARQVAGMVVSVDENHVIVEQEQQPLAIPIAGVTRLQLLNLPLRVHVTEEERKAAGETKLGIAYLRKGMMWIPEYTLQVIDDETAELTLRGTLINEAEDLVRCDVQFVVGVPHFAHSDLLSPLAVGRTIRTMGAGIPRADIPQQVMSQMMNRAVVASNSHTSSQWDAHGDPIGGLEAEGNAELGDLLRQLPSLESAAAGDYAVYTKKDLTIRKGERASVTLFTQEIRYRHRYRWEIPGAVEHLLLLENKSVIPWTTGPCLALSGTLPLSEDILRYTPAGGNGEFQVTTAINLSHAVSEQEIDRELKAHSPRNNEFYDLVTVRGTIRLKCFEKLPVDIQVTLPIDGRPTKADGDGVIRMDATKLRLLERSGKIAWQVSLDPGEETTLNYEYERFVSSH